MDRQLAFTLSVMAFSLNLDRVSGRLISGSIVGQATRVQLPDNGDIEDLAMNYVDYQYDIAKKPKWLTEEAG